MNTTLNTNGHYPKASHLLVWIALFGMGFGNTSYAFIHGFYPTLKEMNLRRTLSTLSLANEKPSPTANRAGKLEYFGGPVLSNVKPYAVFWGSAVEPTTQKGIDGFFATVVDSTYFDWLKEYNTDIGSVSGQQGTQQKIGRGTYGGHFLITPFNTKTTLDDTDVQAELERQFDVGNLPTPDSNALYMIFFPPGVTNTIQGATSCQEFCAYHFDYTSARYGAVAYGVMPDLGGACSFGCGVSKSQFDDLTTVTSHELIEATTDPIPTTATTPAYPDAWNAADSSEIGDLCADPSVRPASLTGKTATYFVQQQWDNDADACTTASFLSAI